MIHLQLPFLEICAALTGRPRPSHAYFCLAGGDTESGSHSGAPETSNSRGEDSSTSDWASILGAAGLEATAGCANGVDLGADSVRLKLAPALAAAAFAARTGAGLA